MSKGVPAVTTGEVGLASGLLGAGIGYVTAPRRYDLEQLLTKGDDVFEKALPVKQILKGTEEEQAARNVLYKARLLLNNELNSKIFESRLDDIMKTPNVNTAYKTVEQYIPKARKEFALILGVLSFGLAVIIKKFTDSNS